MLFQEALVIVKKEGKVHKYKGSDGIKNMICDGGAWLHVIAYKNKKQCP